VSSAERSFSKLKLIKNWSRAVYLAKLNIESTLAQEKEYGDIIKTFAKEQARKCFWNNRDICTSFSIYRLFAHYFRLNLAGLRLSLRIEMQRRMRETSDAWIRRESVKKFQTVHTLKNRKSLLPSFIKNLDEKFFFNFLYWAKLNVFWGFFKQHDTYSEKLWFLLYTRKIFFWVRVYWNIRS